MTKRKPANELKRTKKTAAKESKPKAETAVGTATAEAEVKPAATPETQSTETRTPPPEVEVIPSACPKCGSTKRTGYNAVKEREISGTTRDGRKYQRIQWKRTKCSDCGQNRVDVFYLNSKARKRK